MTALCLALIAGGGALIVNSITAKGSPAGFVGGLLLLAVGAGLFVYLNPTA